ncbi:MAG: tetratricopeptide repeat protein [Clostridiales Family XIII bacterium]|jgi:tetratricopeptide (TPR) repeat protein|nr:tetratricopeptide repeat protein [Clostridiales Family XIII bacterium]
MITFVADDTQDQFKEVWTKYFRSMKDRKSVYALLLDMLPGMKKESRVLSYVFELGIYDLLDAGTDRNLISHRIFLGLTDDHGFDSKLSHWAIDTWFYALNLPVNIRPDDSKNSERISKRQMQTMRMTLPQRFALAASELFEVGEYYRMRNIKDAMLNWTGGYIGTIMPTAYCYNITNNLNVNYESLIHIFENVEWGLYRYLGEGYPYNGAVTYWSKQKGIKKVIGYWNDGVFSVHDHSQAQSEVDSVEPDDTLAEKLKAVLEDPENAHYRDRLGDAFYGLGRYDEALIEHQKAVDIDPEAAYYHYSLGWTLYMLSRYDEALIEHQKTVDIEPEAAHYHSGLGLNLYMLDRYDEALIEYQKAVDIEPEVAYYHSGLGLNFYMLDRYDEALIEYQKAVDIEPENAGYHSSLGEVLQKLGRDDEAWAEHLKADSISGTTRQ